MLIDRIQLSRLLGPHRTFGGLLVVLLACSAQVQAQHQDHDMANHAPAKRLAGLGAVQHPVTTKNAEAQQFFNQGLSLIYAFNHEEAARSFQRAAELDPQLAMAYWGYALAVGPNYNEPTIDPGRMKAASEAVQKAQTLAANASEAERAYIAALAKRFTLEANPDGKKLGAAYSAAMREVYRRFPDDLDAAVLYADSLMNVQPWQLWSRDGKPLGHTPEIVTVLEGVLKRNPQHTGANHLYIHAVEASKNPGRALASARRLGKLAPNAGHLVHMPAHIYLRTGLYADSALSNEAAARVDEVYIKTTGARGMYPAMYYSHNLHFLVESYGRAGNFAKALHSAQRLEANVLRHSKEMPEMAPMIEGFLPSGLFVRLRFAKWNDLLQVPEPPREQKIPHVFWQYARGVACAALGKTAEAEAARAAFLQEFNGLPGETPFGLNSASSVLKIAGHVLDARIAAAQGRREQALAAWRQAVAAQDALNYDEPPGWYYSVRESLGAVLLQAGQAAEAEQVFRAELADNPGNGRALFGLAESLKAQGQTAKAAAVRRDFLKAWRQADTPLRLAEL
jgi:tetratricopeptide (TPR) repeat protein